MFKSYSKYLVSLSIFLLLSACAGLSTKNRQTLDQLEGDAQKTLASVSAKLKQNPESVLQDSLKVLDQILEYTDQVKADPGKFDPNNIQAFMHKIRIINENINRFSDLTLQTDVSFPLGTYTLEHLAAAGKQKSDELIDNVIKSLNELAQKYTGYNVRVIIKTVGYTDKTPVLKGSKLEQELRASLEDKNADSSSYYNQVLSKFRATTLNDYVVQRIKNNLPSNLNVNVVSKIVGRGEALPKQNIQPPYQQQDSRRRICILSPFIEIVP